EVAHEYAAHPAAAHVVRLVYRASVYDHPGKADRHHVVAPVGGESLDRRHHARRGQRWTGRDLAWPPVPAREHLHVRAADVDDQDLRPAAHHVGHCHPPICAVSATASGGPQLPGSYSRTGVAVPRMGWTTAHAASTASSRANSVASPAMASPSRRS